MPLTAGQRSALELGLQGMRSVQGDAINTMLLRGVNMDPEAVKMYLNKRLHWLNYESITQRHWQRTSRRKGRVNHADTLATRERYVRGYRYETALPKYYKIPYMGVCWVKECHNSAIDNGYCRYHRKPKFANKR